MNTIPASILFVDDDPDDLEYYGEAIRKQSPLVSIIEKPDGIQALAYLQQAKADGSLPCLIVMDFNMPLLNGRETFEQIKNDEVLARIPIVIFSTATSHIDEAYFKENGIENFRKPSNGKEMELIAQHLLTYC
jgi:CheY-like chemotaxis protein